MLRHLVFLYILKKKKGGGGGGQITFFLKFKIYCKRFDMKKKYFCWIWIIYFKFAYFLPKQIINLTAQTILKFHINVKYLYKKTVIPFLFLFFLLQQCKAWFLGLLQFVEESSSIHFASLSHYHPYQWPTWLHLNSKRQLEYLLDSKGKT